jgi:hypothetical protein
MDATALMKLYGFPEAEALGSPVEMREMTIVAAPVVLRQLAAFLTHSAQQMEEHGDSFGHEHYTDFATGRADGSPEIVVSRP